MKKLTYTFLSVSWVFASLLISCKPNAGEPVVTGIDTQLEQALIQTSGNKGKDFYLLPNSTDYSKIPQDPRNPITAEKVALGQLLFHETGLSMNPNKTQSYQTYSCASCHHAKAGFQACLPQGIAEGGTGFGITGESRKIATGYADSQVDVQPIRTPSAMNIAYQTNILWNGQFGATHLNATTQSAWTKGTPKEKITSVFRELKRKRLQDRESIILVLILIFCSTNRFIKNFMQNRLT